MVKSIKAIDFPNNSVTKGHKSAEKSCQRIRKILSDCQYCRTSSFPETNFQLTNFKPCPIVCDYAFTMRRT